MWLTVRLVTRMLIRNATLLIKTPLLKLIDEKNLPDISINCHVKQLKFYIGTNGAT
jgi:hypothetical protein